MLLSQRILVVSEAGAGKTHECQAQQAKLWNAGEPAFFLDLATLANSSVREMLGGDGEEDRLDSWLRSQSEIATFFLDSIDELKLTLGKFDQALKRLSKTLDGRLGRARIIITTRPVPIDRQLIAQHLPIPAAEKTAPTAEAFADIVMDRNKKEQADAPTKAWRNVGLMPLSREQMHEFAKLQGVVDPDALLADIRRRDAEEFAERPQDLIELCSDWREHHHIRSHREQVETNVATKLKPRDNRHERAELSQDRAIEGASRLALAAMLTRKLTLRQSADSDDVDASEAALDVSKVLQNWSAAERSTLLERPLFGFASYGRVRFHHRSVIEFLAAKRLDALIAGGVSIKSVKRLLFTQTAQNARVVRPSMRPVAAWLALSRDTIFDEIVALDPASLLDYGDPQSFRPTQRINALEAYAARYGRGGWRGLSTPSIQVHRFAAQELDECVRRLWEGGVENPEVRDLLLRLVAAGKLGGCANIAFTTAMDETLPAGERSLAIKALLQLQDPRLEELSISVEVDPTRWPDAVALRAVLILFPTDITVPRLARVLRRAKERPRSVGDLSYRLPREIETTALSAEYLDELRQALTDLVVEKISWEQDKFPHVQTKRPDLIAALVIACHRQAIEGVRTESWIESSLLAVRLSNERDGEKDALAELHRILAGLSAGARETAFWKEDAFLARLHKPKDAWHRIFDRSRYGGIQLIDEKDGGWVRRRLSDPNEPFDHREMMLWAEMVLLNRDAADRRALLEDLKTFVANAPSLSAIIDVRLKPQTGSAKLRQMELADAKRVKQNQRRAAKARASWVKFWREIAQSPSDVFAPGRATNTAWNLWQAVERAGPESRASGWSRRFIEHQFGKPVADRLRETMMAAWRKDKPTLRSERPDGEKDTFLVRWQFGLAGLAAEAEYPLWAKRLTVEEAQLACRYAPMEMNGFPFWLETLATEHPAAVDGVIGEELSLSLGEAKRTDAYSILLQNISHAPANIRTLFIPRIRSWLSEVTNGEARYSNVRSAHNVQQAIEILVTSGNADDRQFIEKAARKHLAEDPSSSFTSAWLPALLHLNPIEAVETIEDGLKESAASKMGAGVLLFASLADRGQGGIGVDLRAPGFTPPLLLRLLRLVYQHIQVEDDVQHEGPYSVDTRDNAERFRNAVLSALWSTTGQEGWQSKLEMIADPLFSHLKDRTLALAKEKAAEEADNVALTDAEFVGLDRTGESPPTTREAMFALMRDRLDDIDDLLLRDTSPRELWATITSEHVMRRELARVLSEASNHCYTIDQESVTADEKETDIRFRSTGSKQQGTIELKLADERSGRDLFKTLRDQLLTKYMAADECRAGCLLVTNATERQWDHPNTGKKIGFADLVELLNEEATRLSNEIGGAASLMARGIDLRPRLPTEKGKASKKERIPE